MAGKLPLHFFDTIHAYQQHPDMEEGRKSGVKSGANGLSHIRRESQYVFAVPVNAELDEPLPVILSRKISIGKKPVQRLIAEVSLLEPDALDECSETISEVTTPAFFRFCCAFPVDEEEFPGLDLYQDRIHSADRALYHRTSLVNQLPTRGSKRVDRAAHNFVFLHNPDSVAPVRLTIDYNGRSRGSMPLPAGIILSLSQFYRCQAGQAKTASALHSQPRKIPGTMDCRKGAIMSQAVVGWGAHGGVPFA